MKKTIHTFLLAGLLPLMIAGGCKKHEAAAGSPQPETGSSSMAGSASAVKPMAAGSGAMAGSGSAAAASPDVPTPADFETQAATDINDKNLETQLDKIEKDLGK